MTSFAERHANYPTPWGFNGLGEVTYLRTYARTKTDGTLEYWPETVERVLKGVQEIGCDFDAGELERLGQYHLDLKAAVMSRGLWVFGTDMIKHYGAAALLNCYGTVLEQPSDFQWLMDQLMVGGGVGFSILPSNTDKLGWVSPDFSVVHVDEDGPGIFVVPDTRQGWAETVRRVIETALMGGRFLFTTKDVRPAGTPLKTFGGTASGPQALIDAAYDIAYVLGLRRGLSVRPIDALDIANIIGRCVVAGSARRSAEIAVGSADDEEFRNAKMWAKGDIPGWRGNSNNSMATEGFADIPESYWTESWDGDGELLGLLNFKAARTMGRSGEYVDDSDIIVFNPCVTGDTWVLTANGPRQVSDLVGTGAVELALDGAFHRTTDNGFFYKGDRSLITIEADGFSIAVTPNHKLLTPDGWVEARYLKLGDTVTLSQESAHTWDGAESFGTGYLIGHVVGDGHLAGGAAVLSTWGAEGRSNEEIILKYLADIGTAHSFKAAPHSRGDKANLRSSQLGRIMASYGMTDTASKKEVGGFVASASSEALRGFLRGLFDTDGHVEGTSTGGGLSVRLGSIDVELLRHVQRALGFFGIPSKIRDMRPAGETDFGDGYGAYQVKRSYRLIIAGFQNVQRYMDIVGFGIENKHIKASARLAGYSKTPYAKPYFSATVTSLRSEDPQAVYDCEVPGVNAYNANGFVSHNCGEIGLADKEPCNLASIALPNVESYAELIDIIDLLYRVQKHVALLSHPSPHTQAVMNRNTRLGMSMSGIMDATPEQREWLYDAYNYLRERDISYSRSIGVAPSIKLTAEKPDGTIALLFGVSSGINANWSRHYIRRIRVRADNPLAESLRARGYNVVQDRDLAGNPILEDVVVEFPVELPEHAITADQQTAIDQLNWCLWAQRVWADNAVSTTITYRDEEVPAIREWMSKHWDEMKCVSWLRYEDHGFELAPYETITPERYAELRAHLDLRASSVMAYAGDDLDAACAAGVCPIR